MTTSLRRGVVVLTAILVLGVPISGSLQAPVRDPRSVPTQEPRDPTGDAPSATVGKGVISGVVVVAGSGQPARRARVTLSSTDGPRAGHVALTDDVGAFSFAALTAGRYSLMAVKAGYLNATYGQRTPGRSGTPIQLADGQRLQLAVQMWRGGVITGTVLDEYGESVPNTPVRALRYVFQNGHRTLQQSGNAQTDDRGVYRIFNLQPGEYIVSAIPRNTNVQITQPQGAVAEQLAERLAAVSATGAEQPPIVVQRLQELSWRVGVGVEAEDQSTGYAPVYFPGTTAAANATSIPVGPGEEKSGIDFQYQTVPVARIEGIVTTTAGTALPGNVQLTLVSSGNAPGLNQGTRADGQGAFRIHNVAPGQYRLIARATINSGRGQEQPFVPGMPPAGRGNPASGRGRGNPLLAQDATRLWAITDVIVDGRDISNLVVTLQPGVAVSGRIQFEGAAAPPADLTRLRVTLQPVATPGLTGEVMTNAAGRVEADGRFTIASVVPGRYRLSAAGAGQGWYLNSAVLDGQESLDFPVEIEKGTNGATITFSDRQAELTGTITNDRSEPVSDYTLIVYPAESRYRTPQSRRILSSRPATDGRFTFRNLPPGEYRLVPVLDPEPGAWFDPEYLQQLESGSVRVEIAPGEKKEQNLRVPSGA